ncbi:MAG: class I SAM-dependent methyltransferase, partial [Byssovorax sp.]
RSRIEYTALMSLRSTGPMLAFVLPLACAPAAPADAPHEGHHGGHDHPHHHFTNAEQWAKEFDDPARDAWQKPDAVVAALALAPSAKVADIGAGTGYFTVRIARAAATGKVLALDVEPDMVRYLGERARKEGLANIEPRLVQKDDPKLDTPVDIVFVCDTYHHIEDRPAYFRKVAAALAPGGKVVIVDFKLGDIPVGPKHGRIGPVELDTEMQAAGLHRVSLDESTLPYQYIAAYTR